MCKIYLIRGGAEKQDKNYVSAEEERKDKTKNIS